MYSSAFNSSIFTIPIDQTFQNTILQNPTLNSRNNRLNYSDSDDSSNSNSSFNKDNISFLKNKENNHINHKKRNLIFTENLNNDWKILILIKQLNSYQNLFQHIHN